MKVFWSKEEHGLFQHIPSFQALVGLPEISAGRPRWPRLFRRCRCSVVKGTTHGRSLLFQKVLCCTNLWHTKSLGSWKWLLIWIQKSWTVWLESHERPRPQSKPWLASHCPSSFEYLRLPFFLVDGNLGFGSVLFLRLLMKFAVIEDDKLLKKIPLLFIMDSVESLYVFHGVILDLCDDHFCHWMSNDFKYL